MINTIPTHEQNEMQEKQIQDVHEQVLTTRGTGLPTESHLLNKRQLEFPQAINALMFVGTSMFLLYFLKEIVFSIVSIINRMTNMLTGSSSIYTYISPILNGLVIFLCIGMACIVSIKVLKVKYAATRTAAILVLVSIAITVLLHVVTIVNGVLSNESEVLQVILRVLRHIDFIMKTIATIFAFRTYITYTIDDTVAKQVLRASLVMLGVFSSISLVNLVTMQWVIGNISIFLMMFMYSMLLWRIVTLRRKTPIVLSWVAIGIDVGLSIILLILALNNVGMRMLENSAHFAAGFIVDYYVFMNIQFYWIAYLEQHFVITLCFVSLIICVTIFTVRRRKL